MEAELAGPLRAREVFDFQLGKAFETGVTSLLAAMPDEAARLIEAEEALRRGDEISDEDRQMVIDARDVLTEHWPAYRALIGQASRRTQLLPLVAFRRFCTGWEGDGLPAFARGIDNQVDMTVTGELPDMERRAAGAFGYALQYGMNMTVAEKAVDEAVDGPQEDPPSAKNSSGPPSKSDGGPKTSNMKASTADGKSAAGSGRKVRS